MQYKRKEVSPVEAIKWFPRREYDGLIDPSGVEYTDTGWFLDDQEISPGDYIVREDDIRYVMEAPVFEDCFELMPVRTELVSVSSNAS